MNNDRRKAISAAHADLTALQAAISAAIGEFAGQLDDIKSTVENLKDEETDYKEAMPESFQYGEKGEAADAAISALETALDGFEELTQALDTLTDDSKFDEVLSSLDEAAQ